MAVGTNVAVLVGAGSTAAVGTTAADVGVGVWVGVPVGAGVGAGSSEHALSSMAKSVTPATNKLMIREWSSAAVRRAFAGKGVNGLNMALLYSFRRPYL